MAEVGIRKWLKDNGYAQNDDDITYNNGSVFLKGRQFTNATPSADGSTYGDTSSLANAYKAYQSRGLQNEVSGALEKLKGMQSQPRQQFSYDPNTDMQYQAAISQAKKNAKTATNNAMVDLGSRGIGNSSVAVDRANQINQSAMSNVSENVLPQLMAQAYQRYMDQQHLNQQDIANAGSYLQYANNLYQQGVQNDQWDQTMAETQKQNNLNAAVSVGNQLGRVLQPKDDWSNLYNQTDAPLSIEGQSAALQQEGTKLNNQLAKLQLDSYPEEQRLKIQQLQKQIAQIGAAPYRTPEEAEYDKVKLEMAKTELSQLQEKPNSKRLEQTSKSAYSEFLTDLPRITSRDEGLSLIEMYRQDGIDEDTIQNMLKAINSRFKPEE